VRPSGELSDLLPELARKYERQLEFYRTRCERSSREAIDTADYNLRSQWALEAAREKPIREVDWQDLEVLSNGDGMEVAQARWEELKEAVREDLSRGAIAVAAVQGTENSLYDRAAFYALREDLANGWQPRSGVEWTLIETMAQAQRMYLHWLRAAENWLGHEIEDYPGVKRKYGEEVKPPRLSAAAGDRAYEMADRWNRIFLRNLRALRDLRRYAPVVIQNAAQVNIGQQQVNVKD